MVGGGGLPEVSQLRCYMDDITCLLRTAPCKSRLLNKLDKLSKSRSLSLCKGEWNDKVTFVICGEDNIDQLIQRLGK